MAIPGTPAYYREKAAETRAQAEAAEDDWAKRQLMTVARMYEELAAQSQSRADKGERQG